MPTSNKQSQIGTLPVELKPPVLCNIYIARSDLNWVTYQCELSPDITPELAYMLIHQFRTDRRSKDKKPVVPEYHDGNYEWYCLGGGHRFITFVEYGAETSTSVQEFVREFVIVDFTEKQLHPRQLASVERLFSHHHDHIKLYDPFYINNDILPKLNDEFDAADAAFKLIQLEWKHEIWALVPAVNYIDDELIQYRQFHLRNKYSGCVDASIIFLDNIIVLYDPIRHIIKGFKIRRLDTHLAHIQYDDPQMIENLTAAINKTVKPSHDEMAYNCLRDGASPEIIKQIATDLLHNRIFTSRQINYVRDIPMVFMTLTFMNNEIRYMYKDFEADMIYEYYDKAGPRSVNGYPCFFSHATLNRTDTNKVLDLYLKMKRAIDEIN